MTRGKRTLAEAIMYNALKKVGDRTGKDPLPLLKKAVDNIKPLLEVKSRRVGGATYQVPVEVDSRRGTTLAIRWLVTFSRKRRERSMADRLAGEILDASGGRARRSSVAKTCTRWPKRTRRSLTTAGKG